MSEVKALVPLDGSKRAEEALMLLPIVEALGKPYVRLVGVVDESSVVGLPQAQERIEREARLVELYLKDQKGRLDDDELRLVGYEVKTGIPVDEILGAAKRFDAQFILIATHGRSGVERWRLGSVADKVIRGASCNVLVAGPATQRPGLEGGAILLPLDGSKFAEQALPFATQLKAALHAKLHIVRVIGYPTFADDAGFALQAARESAEAYIANLKLKLGEDDVVYDTPLGDAADKLLAYAREHHVGLTVMTSHGRTGFMRAALGSVADRMLGGHNAILVVKPKEGVERPGSLVAEASV